MFSMNYVLNLLLSFVHLMNTLYVVAMDCKFILNDYKTVYRGVGLGCMCPAQQTNCDCVA